MQSRACCVLARDPEPQDWQTTLLARRRPTPAPADALPVEGRKKLWDLQPMLHCSVVGTCLGTAELRALVDKVDGPVHRTLSDHDLHTLVVGHAADKGPLSRGLQKLLERRHEYVIHRFEKAATAAELETLWNQARRGGDVPGAYWAALTHRKMNELLLRRVFGDVHMLSHLVSASNRADLQQLAELERTVADLRTTCERQQAQLLEATGARDASVRSAEAMAAELAALREQVAGAATASEESTSLRQQLADLSERLAIAEARHRRTSAQLADTRALVTALSTERQEARDRERSLRTEVQSLEGLLMASAPGEPRDADLPALGGRTVLYVGGRAAQVPEFRLLVEQSGGNFLSHDGGLEDRQGLLAALVHRADVVLFPVDCVSHDAANMIKRLCQKTGKAFMPLRSSSRACLFAALDFVAVPECEAAGACAS